MLASGLAIVALLTGCGSSPPAGMKISCSGGTSVQPLNRFQVDQVPPTPGKPPTAALTYRDPLHPDQTGTITLAPGEHCTVEPSTKT
jgi:hypothetical protein